MYKIRSQETRSYKRHFTNLSLVDDDLWTGLRDQTPLQGRIRGWGRPLQVEEILAAVFDIRETWTLVEIFHQDNFGLFK